MAHTPFGYNIVGGMAVIDETTDVSVRNVYKNYLSGIGLIASVKEAGLETYQGTVKLIVGNRYYLDDVFYPVIIDRITFEKVQEELKIRAAKLGRLNNKPSQKIKKAPAKFTLSEIAENYTDPIMQAEYIYSLIKSEVL